MVLLELLQLARVFLDYLRIEYLWHVFIMPLTNPNGMRTRLRLSGTDRGGVLWFMPTGRRVSFSATFEDRFLGGRLVEHDGSTDTEGLLRQLGHPKEDEQPGQ